MNSFNMGSGIKPTPETRATKDVAPFLKQLRAMLEDDHSTVLRWAANGRAFEIVDMEQMMNHVLPKYFKHRKYTSFQRQLNYFNFRKWTKSKASVCTFSNEFFRRDQPELAWRITRKKSAHNVASHHYHPRVPPPMLLPASLLQPVSGSPELESALAQYENSPTRVREYIANSVINVSVTSCTAEFLSTGASPSPTDFSRMLQAHDFPACAIEPASMAAPPDEQLESFEWIDVLLPLIDQIEDEVHPSFVCPPRYQNRGSTAPAKAPLYGYFEL
jgi:hypothetical protein